MPRVVMDRGRPFVADEAKWIERASALSPCVRNFVDGRWAGEPSGPVLEKMSPRDGTLLCRLGMGQAQEANEAVAHGLRAFEDGRWADLPVERRKAVLFRFADIIDEHTEELALLECLDVGKPIADALAFDVPMSAAAIRHAAEAADMLCGRVYGADRTSLSYELRRPFGVVAGIIGWNFPLVLAISKIAPALATGNCLILKPSELTSLSAARVAELASEAGVPDGVFNVVHGGPQIGAALALHPDVAVLTFTGSSQTGRRLLIAAGESNMKRLILECGGKAPNIVFEDCPDLKAVADAVVGHAFWNQGQVCTASSRLLVQESIKDRLLALVIERCADLRCGDPLDPRTRLGAVISREHRRKVLDFVESGLREGAKLVYRSDNPTPFVDGFYVPRVIFDCVSPIQRIAQEEIFGPVLSVMSFREEQEAIRIANSTVYGLSAILWTRDLGRAHRMTQGIRAGWIVVNSTGTPRGGPQGAISVGGHKQSGIGTEGGLQGLEAYTTGTAVQFFV